MSKPLSYKIGTAIDRAIAMLNPKRAFERKAYRNAYFGYDAATPTRKDLPFPWDGRAEGMNRASRTTLRARARDLERNSDLMSGVLEALDNNIIGSTIVMQSQSGNKKLNDRIEALWAEWTNQENCDVTETQSFTEMLRMILRRYWVDGGVLVLYCINEDKQIPLQLQVREVDDLATGDYPMKPNGNIVFADGVEMTKQGKPLAYWLNSYSPDTMETTVPERVPADRVTFLWEKDRPSQFREITRLGKTVVRVKDLEDYNQAVAFQQKTLACTSVFVEKEDTSVGFQPGRVANDGKNGRIEQIQAGSVNYMNTGEKVKTLVPTGQAAEFDDYMATQMRIIAASQGLSLEGTTRNVDRVNYSSARQNLIADDKTYSKVKTYLEEHLLRVVYKKFVNVCYLAGLLDGYGFDPNNPAMYRAKWLTEGMPWIDPLKEAQANIIGLQNNTMTLQEICARDGKDWEEVLDQRELENKEMAKRGLVMTSENTTREGVNDPNGKESKPSEQPSGDKGNDDRESDGQE